MNALSTQWIEDHTLDAPDGHMWVRPVDDCPNCGCCTRRLCEKAVATVLDCLTWIDDADGETRARVRACPCSKAPHALMPP